jgi:hypothetical protein
MLTAIKEQVSAQAQPETEAQTEPEAQTLASSEKIEQFKDLVRESIALQQEIVVILNDAMENGYEVSEEFGAQVNEIGEANNQMADLANSDELENETAENLEDSINMINQQIGMLTAIKEQVSAQVSGE